MCHFLRRSLALLGLLAAVVRPVRAGDAEKKGTPPAAVSPREVDRAVERGLAFLEKDAAKWRKEHQCATCHHGTMTVWAFTEARRRGYGVEAETLASAATWTRERLKDIDKPRDPR